MNARALFVTAALLVPAGEAFASMNYTGWVYYYPHGQSLDDTTNTASLGDWTMGVNPPGNSSVSWTDTEYVTNPLPYLKVCLYEMDGCQDKTAGCAENNDQFLFCLSSDVGGRFSGYGPSPTDGGDPTCELYLRTQFDTADNQVIVVPNQVATYKYAVSPTWSETCAAATGTSKSWNASCPTQIANGQTALSCPTPDSWFNSGQNWIAWYPLLFRHASGLRRAGQEIYIPDPDLKGGQCGRSKFQTPVYVVVNQDFAGTKRCTNLTLTQTTDADQFCTYVTSPTYHDEGTPSGGPEYLAPFNYAHELGHVLWYRWMCRQSGDAAWPDECYDPQSQSHGWRSHTTEQCAMYEGWADFVQTASQWPADMSAGGVAIYSDRDGSGARQVELVSANGADKGTCSSQADNRDCECDQDGSFPAGCPAPGPPYPCNFPAGCDVDFGDPDHVGSAEPETCDSTPAYFLWDAYDSNNEDPDGDPAVNGEDNTTAPSFQALLDVLAAFDWGTGDRDNLEDDDDGETAQDFQQSRNMNDYRVNALDVYGLGTLFSERDQNCGSGSTP